MIELADIIKMDFMNSTRQQRTPVWWASAGFNQNAGGKRISHSQMARLQLLQKIKKGELERSSLEDIFRREVVLSYKLLKSINSPVFGGGCLSALKPAQK